MSDETTREVGVRQGAVGDAASADVVERVWRRLDGKLDGGWRLGRRRQTFVWAAVACAGTFALGVTVGQGGLLPSDARTTVALGAEPRVEAPRRESAEASRPQLLEDEPEDVRPRDRESRPPRGNTSAERRRDWQPSGVDLDAEAIDPSEAVAPVELVAPVPTEAASVPALPPSWQRLANAGEYEAALFELGQQGGFEAAVLSANAEQLMLLADVARATGQTQRALAAFRRVVSEFRGEPVAPLAAYSLGALLQKAGDGRAAAKAFAVYRTLSPEGDFAEDALVRQLRSAVERDDRDYAEQLAAQYRMDFPEGRRGEEVDRWLDDLAVREQARIQHDAGAGEESEPAQRANDEAELDEAPAPEAPVAP